MFDHHIRDRLQLFTESPPIPNSDVWDGLWTSVLTDLFPSLEGYILQPKRRFPANSALLMEILKMPTSLTMPFRTVLVIEIRNNSDWQAGIPAQEARLKCLINAAFAGNESFRARTKVYWISVIGPHWRYGYRNNNGEDITPLIEWHHTTHDQDSYQDFQDLAGLVAVL